MFAATITNSIQVLFKRLIRIYTLVSGPRITYFSAVVSMSGKISSKCRQQMTTTKLLYKYFSSKHFQIGITFDLTVINNQIWYYLTANKVNCLEARYDF